MPTRPMASGQDWEPVVLRKGPAGRGGGGGGGSAAAARAAGAGVRVRDATLLSGLDASTR